jgi:hypothetical protein
MMTLTASSTWHRPPQIQRGDLCPDSAVAKAVHLALCTLHQSGVHRPRISEQISTVDARERTSVSPSSERATDDSTLRVGILRPSLMRLWLSHRDSLRH